MFVMACGIVVRSIAYIKDKASDPAVLVVDEKGQHVMFAFRPYRGANKLAKDVQVTGGKVITTATDINNVMLLICLQQKTIAKLKI